MCSMPEGLGTVWSIMGEGFDPFKRPDRQGQSPWKAQKRASTPQMTKNPLNPTPFTTPQKKKYCIDHTAQGLNPGPLTC